MDKGKSLLVVGITTLAVCSLVAIHTIFTRNSKKLEKEETSDSVISSSVKPTVQATVAGRNILILYATTTGTAKTFAHKLHKRLESLFQAIVTVQDIKDFDEEGMDCEDIVLLISSTWQGGTPPESCKRFYYWLQDIAQDFRVNKNVLSSIQFAVFGLGGIIYGSNYCKAVKEMNDYLLKLGANSILDLELGDDATEMVDIFNDWSRKLIDELEFTHGLIIDREEKSLQLSKMRSKRFKKIQKHTKSSIKAKKIQKLEKQQESEKAKVQFQQEILNNDKITVGLGYDTDEEDEEDRINNAYVTMDSLSEANKFVNEQLEANIKKSRNMNPKQKEKTMSSIQDLEDLGAMKKPAKTEETLVLNPSDEKKSNIELEPPSTHDHSTCDSHNHDDDDADNEEKGYSTEEIDCLKLADGREMVTKLQRKALVKEGYRIIGTHSAVKLCRWTKNQMRGRGGCYKHTCYGITSYQCMEATPSLACANKCVFCWRHHKNPVGTEWRWKEDPPKMIVDEAIRLHVTMINEMKGVPGVIPERLQEAYTVKHCALSLVGEPIIYPHINQLLRELHNKNISTFLVTNAQFPEQITDLDPVTQLYVSVDAATPESLKAVDRPLFEDYWERFLASLKALREKQQRTVYRMTLVKSWNMEEAENYVQLIEEGQPDLIEIKAVTYCGKSDASSLTMAHCPWHWEVVNYCEAICQRLKQRGKLSFNYSIAAEHEHSCLCLIAREDKFKIDERWYTWIDYDKYTELISAYYEHKKEGKDFHFTSVDYRAPTPDWALYRSENRGFDPADQRWRRKKTTGELVEFEYKASDSGCG